MTQFDAYLYLWNDTYVGLSVDNEVVFQSRGDDNEVINEINLSRLNRNDVSYLLELLKRLLNHLPD